MRQNKDRPQQGKNGKEDIIHAFFVISADALDKLKSELQLHMPAEGARAVIYRFGHSCGTAMADMVDVDSRDSGILKEFIESAWNQVGLGNLVIHGDLESDDFLVAIKDNVELAEASFPVSSSSSFTAGYIAGFISPLLEGMFVASEVPPEDDGGTPVPGAEKSALLKINRQVPKKRIFSGDSLESWKGISLEEGSSYLVRETHYERSMSMYQEIGTEDNMLCFTRAFPGKLKKHHPTLEGEIHWLTSEKMEKALREERVKGLKTISSPHLGEIYDLTCTHLRETANPIILLEGLEYLITSNGYGETQQFLHMMAEKVAYYAGIMVVPVSPEALDHKDLRNIERDMIVVDPGES